MRRRVMACAILAATLGLGCRGAPGTPAADRDITREDMRARISFLAADRLRGRGTPSEGLDIAAAYIESEFRRMGLNPSKSGYTQRYQLVMSDMGDGWSLALRRGSRRATLRNRTDFWGLPWTAGSVEGRLRFVGSASPGGPAEDDEPTIWVARLSPSTMPRDWQRAASAAGAVGLLLVTPSEGLEPQVRHWLSEGEAMYELGDIEVSVPAAMVSEEALTAAMEELGLDAPPEAQDDGLAPGGQLSLAADLTVETLSAPNVLGIIRGRDRRLRNEYVLVSAHMDGLGVGFAVDGDSIYNGADDNASGTAAILEVAEAMAELKDEGPRRSVAFLAVSGEERGLLGSAWFVEHPPIPLERIVANVNIDMIGRNWEDTIAVVGKPYSSLGALVDSVAMAHPELGLTTVDDQWPADGFFFRSDHFNFARKGIPAVFFFNGVHADYHRPSDEVDKIKFEKASRIARLVYEVALAIANADDRPTWDPEGRRRIVEGEQ
ncbi:MAG: M20/M25/M40 family metallo-hydrolase [Gemmatimonadota bacterium]|nr:MAG: M20/M25/M40 family metallo-hydrolase [Gemmatimonadota bacterium]